MTGTIMVLWAGTMAMAALLGGLAVSVPRYRQGEGSLTGLIAFAFGLVFAGVFTITSMGYTVTTQAGIVMERSEMAFAVIGLLLAVTCLILLIDGATRTADFR